jgi:hypothetical protein
MSIATCPVLELVQPIFMIINTTRTMDRNTLQLLGSWHQKAAPSFIDGAATFVTDAIKEQEQVDCFFALVPVPTPAFTAPVPHPMVW